MFQGLARCWKVMQGNKRLVKWMTKIYLILVFKAFLTFLLLQESYVLTCEHTFQFTKYLPFEPYNISLREAGEVLLIPLYE